MWLHIIKHRVSEYDKVGGEAVAVVAERKIGETVVRIHDDSYKGITKDAIELILKRIAAEALPALTASAYEMPDT